MPAVRAFEGGSFRHSVLDELVRGSRPSGAELALGRQVVESALSLYGPLRGPVAGLEVILATELRIGEYDIAGLEGESLDDPRIYVSLRVWGDVNPQPISEVETTIHHEIAGLVFESVRTSRFLSAWNDANPPDFEYLADWRASSSMHGRFTQEELAERGFVDVYGMTDVSNDFSTIASACFMRDEGLFQTARSSTRIRQKIALVAEAYARAGLSPPGLAWTRDPSEYGDR